MLLRQLIELITPTPCYGCNREGALLCRECIEGTTLPAPACFSCGRLTDDGRACGACRRRMELDGAIVASHYESAVRELVLALKFGRAQAAVRPAVELILRSLPEELIASLDGITAVPVAAGRHRERGYNQSELVAKGVARRLGLPYRSTLRRHSLIHQMGAGRRDRFAQVAAAFEATRSVSGRWLIIDDVITTGATLNACATALRASGASRVSAAVVAGQRG